MPPVPEPAEYRKRRDFSSISPSLRIRFRIAGSEAQPGKTPAPKREYQGQVKPGCAAPWRADKIIGDSRKIEHRGGRRFPGIPLSTGSRPSHAA